MSEEDNKSLRQESTSGNDEEAPSRGRSEAASSSGLDREDVCFLLDMDGGGGLCFEAVAASEAIQKDKSGDWGCDDWETHSVQTSYRVHVCLQDLLNVKSIYLKNTYEILESFTPLSSSRLTHIPILYLDTP